MSSFDLIIDDAAVQRAFNIAPALALKEIGAAVRSSTNRIARDARRLAPKAFSTLTNSINGVMIDPLTGEVAPGVDYARMVEEGTWPGGRPPLQSIIDWVKVKRIEPRNPAMGTTGLAMVIADSIAEKGTPAQPYLQPALEKNRAATVKRVDDAIDRVLAKMGRA